MLTPARTIEVACLSVFFALGTGSCVSTPGARPHDMAATGHEAHARSLEQSAERHAALYNPKAESYEERCVTGGRGDGLCWTRVGNPTEEHRNEADRLRKMAADLRKASEALRVAEAQACVGCPSRRATSAPSATARTSPRSAPTLTRRTPRAPSRPRRAPASCFGLSPV